MLGVSVVLIGAVPVAQALGVPDRVAYTAAGLAIVVLWLLPFDWLDALSGTDLRMDFSVWIVGGLLLVVGATWLIIYNADVLLGLISASFGRIRSLRRSYGSRSRIRCGTCSGRA